MKKTISVLAVMLLVIITVVTLTACNPYKWESGLSAGDSGAPVESNGGYFVKQGSYAYFINGKGADAANNEFGVPFKQSIMRAPIKDNVVDSTNASVVVPQVIYNENVNGGFAIFDDFIYYLTPNNELGPDKKPNTTMSNLMRTKTDGSITQRIATFGSRNVNLLYTPTRVLYFENQAIKYFDFSGMKTNKNRDDGKGVTSGTLATNVSEVMWNTNSDYIFYTQAVDGDDSYRRYNKLVAVKPNGEDEKVLITKTTFVDGELTDNNIVDNYGKIYITKLINIYVENKDTVALYYSLTPINEGAQAEGFYVREVKNGSFSSKQKKLSTVVPTATIYPLGYAKGCIAPVESGFVWYEGNSENLDVDNQNLTVMLPSSNKILNVINDEVYFTPTDTSAVYKVALSKGEPERNMQLVIQEKISEWFVMDWDIVKDDKGLVTNAYMYFFAADDYTYLHCADLLHFRPTDDPYVDANGNNKWDKAEAFEDANKNGTWDKGETFTDANKNGKWDDAEEFVGEGKEWTGKQESVLIGVRTDEDQKAFDEAHKEKEDK